MSRIAPMAALNWLSIVSNRRLINLLLAFGLVLVLVLRARAVAGAEPAAAPLVSL